MLINMAKADQALITKESIKPLAGYILVEPIPAETRTASGIILPETAQERPAIGKVVAVGDSLYLDGREIKSPVSVGDKVFYKKWGGDEIKIGGEELRLVGFSDIMALVK